MGTKFDILTNTWSAFHSKRHPVTRIPISLRRIKLSSKAEAMRVERQLIIEVEDKIRRQLLPTWRVHLNSFYEHMRQRDYSLKTVDTYKLCLDAHTVDIWGERLITQISAEDIRSLIRDRLGHRSVSHQANLLKFIRAAFNYAVEKAFIPAAPIPFMKFKKHDKIQKGLTNKQAELLLDTARTINHEWYPHWCMALYTGMRNGELYALTWDNVDLEKRQIIVNCSWNNKDGFKSTKTGQHRILEIPPDLLPVLRQLKIQSQNDCPFVLPRLRKWDKGEQARELRMFLMGLGLPTIRFHDLRATWATLLLSSGVNANHVKSMGGWEDLKTMQIYIRKSGMDIRGCTDNFTLHDPYGKQSKVISLNYESATAAVVEAKL